MFRTTTILKAAAALLIAAGVALVSLYTLTDVLSADPEASPPSILTPNDQGGTTTIPGTGDTADSNQETPETREELRVSQAQADDIVRRLASDPVTVTPFDLGSPEINLVGVSARIEFDLVDGELALIDATVDAPGVIYPVFNVGPLLQVEISEGAELISTWYAYQVGDTAEIYVVTD